MRAAHSPHYRISLLIRSSLWSRKCRACSSANFHLYFKADQCCPSAAALSALLTSSFWPCVADTCYILSFAIIMLNTSLHNPNVKDKPSVERFISMNRGINDGGDLPEDLLTVRCTQKPGSLTSNVCLVCHQHLLLLAESVRQHKKWTVQDPRRWRQRPHTHFL